MVYQILEDAGNEGVPCRSFHCICLAVYWYMLTAIDYILYTYSGIWVRYIKSKHKILKTLESKKLVKPVKLVQVSRI